jgi:hypothetical protein
MIHRNGIDVKITWKSEEKRDREKTQRKRA